MLILQYFTFKFRCLGRHSPPSPLPLGYATGNYHSSHHFYNKIYEKSAFRKILFQSSYRWQARNLKESARFFVPTELPTFYLQNGVIVAHVFVVFFHRLKRSLSAYGENIFDCVARNVHRRQKLVDMCTFTGANINYACNGDVIFVYRQLPRSSPVACTNPPHVCR